MKELFAYWTSKGKTVSLEVNGKTYTDISKWKDGDLLLTSIVDTDTTKKYCVQYIKKAANTSAGNATGATTTTQPIQQPLVSVSNAQ